MIRLRHLWKPLKLPIVICLVVAPLTWFVWEGSNQAAANVLTIPLFPGLIAGMLIFGVHGGGTSAQDTAAFLVSVIVNVAFYAGVFWLISIIEYHRTPLAGRGR